MTDIKYRGFFEGRMFKVEKINFYLRTVEFIGSLGIYDIDKLHNPLMQFTGMKDKNGIDIYEGDIIKYNCNSLLRFVAWHNEYSRFVLAYRPDLGDSDDLKEFSLKLWSAEVVSNIHQKSQGKEE